MSIFNSIYNVPKGQEERAVVIDPCPLPEANLCQCGHGGARHSDKIISSGPSKGHLCLIPVCACYQFKAGGQ